eukprot:Opistho-2@8501
MTAPSAHDGVGADLPTLATFPFVSFRAPLSLIASGEWSFLASECTFYLVGLLTLVHAARYWGHFPWYLWLATVAHGLATEVISYVTPYIDNFWHAQSTVVVFRGRFPLHIACLYPAFIYLSSMAVTRLRLPRIAEPFAVGLCAVIADAPYDILVQAPRCSGGRGMRQTPILVIEHTTCRGLAIFFHATFSSTLLFAFRGLRRAIGGCRDDGDRAPSAIHELVAVVLTGLLTFPLAVVLQFGPLFHLPNLLLGVSTEPCVWVLFGFYGIAMLRAVVTQGERRLPCRWERDKCSVLVAAALVHFACYATVVCLADPSAVRAVGFHQSAGTTPEDCAQWVPVYPGVEHIRKQPSLCLAEHGEPFVVADGHTPARGSQWYALAGTLYVNYGEHAFVVLAICTLGLSAFCTMLRSSDGKKAGKDE